MRSVQLAPATPNGEKTDHILPVKSTKYYSFSMRLNPDRSLPMVRRDTYVNGVVPSPLRCVSAMEQKLHYKARAILSMSTWDIGI